MRLGFSGKYGGGFYYRAQVDWGASAKQQSTLGDADGMNDITSVDETFMGYKLSKNSTISIGKQKIPLSSLLFHLQRIMLLKLLKII